MRFFFDKSANRIIVNQNPLSGTTTFDSSDDYTIVQLLGQQAHAIFVFVSATIVSWKLNKSESPSCPERLTRSSVSIGKGVETAIGRFAWVYLEAMSDTCEMGEGSFHQKILSECASRGVLVRCCCSA